MKFKSQDKQNQLIEKITAQHLVIGIDIAQQTHVARAVNFRGIALGNPLTFSNDEEGFQILLRWIHSLQVSHNLSAAIMGMEPTGHYWLNVSRWLSKRQFEVVLVNPHLVKKIRKTATIRHLRVTKRCTRHCRHGQKRLLLFRPRHP
ncbi:transposase [Paenibacillus mucilaginosus]